MFDSDYNPAIRAGIPVGVRAALDHGDPAPLLRLAARPPGPLHAAGAARRSPPPATPPCARRRRCRGRAGRRSASARRARRRRRTALGPGAFFPFGYAEARADEIDLCLRWPEASPAAGARRRLPGGAGADPPGRRGPADAAGGLRARGGGAAGRAARACVPGVGHAVVGRRPLALRRAAAVRVPARAPRVGAVPAGGDAGAGRAACRRGRCGRWRRRPACAGCAGARWRRSTSRSTT